MHDEIDLKACIRGDKRAWDALVEGSVNLIYAAVQRTVGKRQNRAGVEVDDIVQDVYARLIRDDCRLLRRFDPRKASLVTYLTLIARSTAIDALKRRTPETVSLEPEHQPAQTPLQGEKDSISDATKSLPLDLLSERQRLILHLLFNREMSVVEAAAVLGVEPQTIRSGKHKALMKLREALSAGDEPATPFVERQ